MTRAWFASLLFLGFGNELFAQNIFMPINRWQNLKVTQHLLESDSLIHSEIQPYTTFTTQIDREKYKQILRVKPRRTWIGRKLKSENLVEFKNEEFFLTFDLLGDLQAGQDDFTTENTFQNTRLAVFNGEINSKVSFFTSFYENQGVFPNFVSSYIKTYNVVPGNGRVKSFGVSGFDYAMASAMVNFNINSWFNFQFGHHKNFIGDGYRSILLSDNAFNYPHLKLIFKSPDKKWVYQNIYAALINLNRLPATTSSEPQFERKAATFHYLSYKPNKFFTLGLFEGNVWQRRTATETLPINYNFFNPIIFFNSAATGFNKHQTNNNLGVNFSINPVKNLQVYGQCLVGGFSNFTKGFQLGAKLNKQLIIGDVSFLAEINQTDPNLYNSAKGLSYQHYNQPLAFVPIISNNEINFLFDYNVKDFFIATQYSVGSNRDFSVKTREFVKGEVGYLLNPLNGLKISVSYTGRTVFDSTKDSFGDANWFALNFSSSLNRAFFDF